jgi:hypothetical protein
VLLGGQLARHNLRRAVRLQWLWLALGSDSLSRLAALVERAGSLRTGMVPRSQATAGVAIAVAVDHGQQLPGSASGGVAFTERNEHVDG